MTAPVIDAEVEESSATRPFRVITHKPGVLSVFAPFGGTQDIGVSVDAATAATDLWWMPQDWAVQVLRAGIALPQLLAPPPGFVAGLPERWRNRAVGTLRKRDIPGFFAKHPDYAQAHPRVVVSVPGEHTELLPPQVCLAEELASGAVSGFEAVDGETMLQLDEMLPCVVEVRCWIADGEVTAAAPYRLGMVGWESSLFLEMLFNSQGQDLTAAAADFARRVAADVEAPPGYALDIGVTLDGTATVLRAWPAWAAEPFAADPTGVLQALTAAHAFDATADRWRWTPDLRAYPRPAAEPDSTADDGPTAEEIEEMLT